MVVAVFDPGNVVNQDKTEGLLAGVRGAMQFIFYEKLFVWLDGLKTDYEVYVPKALFQEVDTTHLHGEEGRSKTGGCRGRTQHRQAWSPLRCFEQR